MERRSIDGAPQYTCANMANEALAVGEAEEVERLLGCRSARGVRVGVGRLGVSGLGAVLAGRPAEDAVDWRRGWPRRQYTKLVALAAWPAGTPAPVEVLARLAGQPREPRRVRAGASVALVRALGVEAVPALLAAWLAPGDRSGELMPLRRWPAEVRAALVPGLLALLADPSPGRRERAAEALARVGRAGIEPLVATVCRTPDARILEAAQVALSRISLPAYMMAIEARTEAWVAAHAGLDAALEAMDPVIDAVDSPAADEIWRAVVDGVWTGPYDAPLLVDLATPARVRALLRRALDEERQRGILALTLAAVLSDTARRDTVVPTGEPLDLLRLLLTREPASVPLTQAAVWLLAARGPGQLRALLAGPPAPMAMQQINDAGDIRWENAKQLALERLAPDLGPGDAPLLVRLAGDPAEDRRVGRRALELVGPLASAADWAALVARWASADYLAAQAPPSGALPPAVKSDLAAGLTAQLGAADLAVRQRATAALKAIGSAAWAPVVQLLRAGCDARTRQNALEVLSSLGGGTLEATLAQLSADSRGLSLVGPAEVDGERGLSVSDEP